jgi:hypothetical protein
MSLEDVLRPGLFPAFLGDSGTTAMLIVSPDTLPPWDRHKSLVGTPTGSADPRDLRHTGE